MMDIVAIQNLLEQVNQMISKQQSSEFPLYLIKSLCLERLYFNARYKLTENDFDDDGPEIA